VLIALVGYVLFGYWDGFPPPVAWVGYLMLATCLAVQLLPVMLFQRLLRDVSTLQPRHTRRLALCAALIGPVGYVLFGLWDGFPPEVTWVEHLMYATCLALSVLLPVMLFRRLLASMPWTAALPVAVLGLFLVALCLSLLSIPVIYLAGDTIEEIEGESGLSGILTALGLGWSVGTLMFVAALQYFYVSLPLSWLSVLLLRWASGGIEGDDRSPPGMVRASELRARKARAWPSSP